MICAKSIMLVARISPCIIFVPQASFSEELPQAGHILATPLDGLWECCTHWRSTSQ